MPNIESKRKNVRKIAINNRRNNAVKSRVKTAVRKLRTEVLAGADPKTVKELLDNAKHELGKAAAKGIVHRNNAARRMARLDALIKANQAKQPATTAQAAPAEK